MRHLFWTKLLSICSLVGLVLALATPQPAQAGPRPLQYDCNGDPQDDLVSVYVNDGEQVGQNYFTSLPEAIESVVAAHFDCRSDFRSSISITSTKVAHRLPESAGKGDWGEIVIFGNKDMMPIRDYGKEALFDTPITFRDMKFEVGMQGFIRGLHSTSIKNSEFVGTKPGAIALMDEWNYSTDGPYLGVTESTFKDIQVAEDTSRYRNVYMRANTFIAEKYFPNFFFTQEYTRYDGGSTKFIKNKMVMGKGAGKRQMLRLARPHIEVSGNTFISDKSDQVTAIELVSPEKGGPFNYDDKDVVGDVVIEANTFKGKRAIGDTTPEGKGRIEFGKIKFSYNDFGEADEILPKNDTVKSHTDTEGPCNYWGDLNKRNNVKAKKESMETVLNSLPIGSGEGCGKPIEQPVGKPRLQGPSRVETAVATSQDAYPTGTAGVVIARADVYADSIAAGPLSVIEGVPVLLTQTDSLHPATAAEIKRLLPKGGRAYIMGGPAAISEQTEAAIKAITGDTRRLAGDNRMATAAAVADYLDHNSQIDKVFVTDGADWQPALIAGATAAQNKGAVLLTWGDKMSDETQAFLNTHKGLRPIAIGSAASKTGVASQKVDVKDPEELSLEVIKTFFTDPPVIGIATTADFADALTGGAHIAKLGGPLALVSEKTPRLLLGYIEDTTSIKRVVIYGGTKRITAQQETDLLTMLKH